MIFLICAWLFSGSEKASAPPQQVTFVAFTGVLKTTEPA